MPSYGGELSKTTADSIMARIREDKLARERAWLEKNVSKYLARMQPDGSFKDCYYVSQCRDDGAVLTHLIRLREMGISYTQVGNKYCGSDKLFAQIIKGLEYWYAQHWTDLNWWQNRVSHPQRLGETFIAMMGGKRDIRRQSIFRKFIKRWRDEMGDPDSPANPTTAGANKCDISMHWLYRACLTLNQDELEKAVDRSFLIVSYTTGEGLQHDGSFQQHGSQLYIGGYGTEFIQSVTRLAYYLMDTEYALSPEKLKILSSFVRDTYLKTIRGRRMSFNVLGRGLTRTDNTDRSSFTKILFMLISVDNEHAEEYASAIKRLNTEGPASIGLEASDTYYGRSEYTLHQRQGYTFEVRTASKHLVRSEYDKNENRLGFFLTDGVTGIYVDGEEYGSIIPIWDWRMLPGTTTPNLAVMRRADKYLFNGRSACAGGVSDGLYSVTAFDMRNDQALYAFDDDEGAKGSSKPVGERLPPLDFGAKKSWFAFDREIVCLGAGIYSGHEEPLYTTINQCRQAGNVVVKTATEQRFMAPGEVAYRQAEWVLNDKVAYYFPDRPTVHVSYETRTGCWRTVNIAGSTARLDEKVFTLWIDHGVRPEGERYAYIIVPGIRSATDAARYQPEDIEILSHTDTIHAVYHRQLERYGLAFFDRGVFEKGDVVVRSNGACAVMMERLSKDEWKISVSGLRKLNTAFRLEINIPGMGTQEITCAKETFNHKGQTIIRTF
jgi:chondroitin AC lyase